jgi:hypothetical protein
MPFGLTSLSACLSLFPELRHGEEAWLSQIESITQPFLSYRPEQIQEVQFQAGWISEN